MSMIALEALPLSRQQIRDFSTQIRKAVQMDDHPFMDVQSLIDFILPKIMPGFYYDVRSIQEMGEKHGEAAPSEGRISIRADVFDGMVAGVGRDRFTVAHEISHLLLHTPDRIVLNRRGGTPPPFRDPEWQANCLAGELLAHHKFINQYSTVHEMARKAGISLPAAKVQWNAYEKDKLIGGGVRKAN